MHIDPEGFVIKVEMERRRRKSWSGNSLNSLSLKILSNTFPTLFFDDRSKTLNYSDLRWQNTHGFLITGMFSLFDFS